MSRRIVVGKKGVDVEQWERFVHDHPQGNIFQMPGMFDVYEATSRYLPLLLVCYEEDELQGILLAVVQKESSGWLGKLSARSIIWGGPLAVSEDVANDLLQQYDRIVKNKAVYSQVRNLYGLDPWLQASFAANGFSHEDHLNILIDLRLGLDEFWRGIKSNRKRGINKAKKQGFEFEVTDDPLYLGAFYRLLEITYNKIRLPIPDKEFFVLLNSRMAASVRWFVLKKNGMPLIIMIALLDDKTVRPYYIGGPEESELLQFRPADYFHYKVICWAIENGFELYDWMGAGKPGEAYGVRDFKMQYGGELVEFGRFAKIHKPWIMKLARIGFWFWRKVRG